MKIYKFKDKSYWVEEELGNYLEIWYELCDPLEQFGSLQECYIYCLIKETEYFYPYLETLSLSQLEELAEENGIEVRVVL